MRANPGPGKLLTIELVPSTCWFSNLRSELSSADWDRLRKATYRAAGYRCEICGGKGAEWPVEAHEIWEYDDNSHTQTLKGLIALCPPCHEVKHIGLAGLRGQADKARVHLARVNGWSPEDAELYIEASFEQWGRRSRHEWRLDLSWLRGFDIDITPVRRSGR